MQSTRFLLAIGAGTGLFAASFFAPSAARAYRAWEVERRQAAITAAIEAARRGDDSLPSIPLADPEATAAASGDAVTDGADPQAGERDDAALRAAYMAAELGIRTPQFNAELARIAQQEAQRWRGFGNDAALAPVDSAPFAQSPTVQGSAPWRSMGPYWARSEYNGTYYTAADTGRVMTVKVHPTDSKIVYIGTSGGGIWKNARFNDSSQAAGSSPTWVPLTDSLGSLAIGAFDVALSDHNVPNSPIVFYVGLGDAFDQQFGGWTKSVDGGATWMAAQILTAVHPADGASVFAQQVREVTIDPNDNNHVFFTSDAGLFVTSDGGATFTLATLPKPPPYSTSREGTWSIDWLGGTSWIVSGVYACPGFNGPNVALQMFGVLACPAPNAGIPGNGGDVWRSTDNGVTWTSMRGSGQLADLIAAAGASGIGRIDLAVAPAGDPAQARVYAVAASQTEANGTSSTIGIIRSDDGGQTWTLKARVSSPATPVVNMTSPPSTDCTNMNLGHAQSYYDLAIAVDPGNPDHVIAAGNLCSVRSRDGGATWENTSHWLPSGGGGTSARGPLPYAHSDWHTALVSRVGGPVVVFGGTDGGLFVSRDLFDRDFGEQVHWDFPDYGITSHLMYSVGSGDPTTGNPQVLYSGLQDNGTRWALNTDNESIFTSVELKVWDQLIGGDGIGTMVALDPSGKNPTYWASVQQSRRFCRPRARDCGKATRVERGTERGNWLAISLASVLPAGDGEPFAIRYADLGDGWVLSASNQNLWRLRTTENDSVQVVRLTAGANPTITGCGSTAARTIRGAPAVSPQYTLDGVPARLYGLPLNSGCFAVVTDKTQPGAPVSTTTTGVPVSLRANDANGNTVVVSFTSSVAFPQNAASLGGTDPRQSFLVSSNAPAALDANSFAVIPIPAEVGRIFKTIDGGNTWIPFHGNGTSDLPNVPVFVVRYDPSDSTDQTIYAGTELGLYRSTDGGQTWARLGLGLPLVRITDLHISKNGSVVRASTFGRGMWEIHVNSEATQIAGNGDYDRNGVIDWFDLSALATRMGVPPLTNPTFPTTPWYDTIVDLGGANPALIQEDDLTALLAKFGSTP